MFKKVLGIIFIIVGVLILIGSLVADFIGIGKYPGINGTQLMVAGLGLVVALAGVWFVVRKPSKKK